MGFVLGLNGPAGAGKDTVADYLISVYGWDAKLSFAHNLKDICKKVFFLTDEDVNLQEGKKRCFSQPKVFTQDNLNAIFSVMCRTHGHLRPLLGAKEKVRSLIGVELPTPRRILQLVGTDVCRELFPSYHVDVLIKQIKDSPEGRFIITDARFPNEGDVIIDVLEGFVAYVDRPAPSTDSVDRTHASETAMGDWGRFGGTIDNHREGLNFLYVEVDNFLEKYSLCPTQS